MLSILNKFSDNVYLSKKKSTEKLMDLKSKQLLQSLFSFNNVNFDLVNFYYLFLRSIAFYLEVDLENSQSASDIHRLKCHFLMVGIILNSFRHSLKLQSL